MNSLDILLVVLAVVVAWSGYRRGALHQVFALGGLLAGLVAGVLLAPQVAAAIGSDSAGPPIAISCMLVGAAVGALAGRLIGGRVRSVAHKTPLRPVDKVIGAGVAVVIYALVIWLVSYNLVAGPSQALARAIDESQVVRTLDAALPEPPDVLAQVRIFVDRYGFPQVFTGLPPEPGGPVDPPTEDEARRAFAAASGSTVEIVGTACEQVHEGSGFVADEGLIVTNAHVVAGVAAPSVQMADAPDLVASVVLFDPRLDVAILRVEGPTGPTLELSAERASRGSVGVAAGYPGGGTLAGAKAAVRRTIPAVGRDIYGQGRVQRDVIELQAEIRPGNSGGPFVLEDGSVAGLVFASSPSDPDIGYAIAADEIAPAIERGITANDPVATGRCLP